MCGVAVILAGVLQYHFATGSSAADHAFDTVGFCVRLATIWMATLATDFETGYDHRFRGNNYWSRLMDLQFGQQLVLASASPRRQQSFSRAGFQFVVEPACVDETIPPATEPVIAVETLALRKATAIAERYPERVIVGADTIVFHQDHRHRCEQVLGQSCCVLRLCTYVRQLGVDSGCCLDL